MNYDTKQRIHLRSLIKQNWKQKTTIQKRSKYLIFIQNSVEWSHFVFGLVNLLPFSCFFIWYRSSSSSRWNMIRYPIRIHIVECKAFHQLVQHCWIARKYQIYWNFLYKENDMKKNKYSFSGLFFLSKIFNHAIYVTLNWNFIYSFWEAF